MAAVVYHPSPENETGILYHHLTERPRHFFLPEFRRDQQRVSMFDGLQGFLILKVRAQLKIEGSPSRPTTTGRRVFQMVKPKKKKKKKKKKNFKKKKKKKKKKKIKLKVKENYAEIFTLANHKVRRRSIIDSCFQIM